MEDLILALQIMSKYDKPVYPTHCSHDELTVCVDPTSVTRKDIEELERLGFIAGDCCFTSFKYGSC